MTAPVHPYIRLRQKIRQAGQQFRRNNDNSTSLFHPNGGFVYAYDMTKVEDVLNEYESTLPTEFLSVSSAVVMESQIIREARDLSDNHPEMDVRDFARQVLAYLVIHGRPQEKPRPLFSLASVPDALPDVDTLS